MHKPSEAAQEHLKQLGIICFAIMSGVVIFAGVVWYLMNASSFSPPEGIPAYLAALFNLVALVAIVKAQLLPRIHRPPHPDAPEESHLAWHKRGTIIAFALREGGAFMALVGVLLTGRQGAGFALAGLAILAMVAGWPRVGQIPRGNGA